MGFNVQDMVGSKLWFIYAAILKGERSSDYKSYMKSSLLPCIEIPPWYFVVGNNAYVCIEHLLTTFMGSSHYSTENDAYIF